VQFYITAVLTSSGLPNCLTCWKAT